MLEQHVKFIAEKLPDILFQTYIYHLVNKKGTFKGQIRDILHLSPYKPGRK